MWGSRVIIPESLKEKVLEELHCGHQGVVRMKQLARTHVWWPNSDKNIEQYASSCQGCYNKRTEPPQTSLHPWEYPTGPWQRIHMDLAESTNGKTYLLLIDAFSKWVEIFEMRKTTSQIIINRLTEVFATWGLPLQVITDNGPQFKSDKFRRFMK